MAHRIYKHRPQHDPERERSTRHARQVENRLKSAVYIETDRDDVDALSKCDAQLYSPLFTLPFVVREQIFELVLSQYEDDTRPYDKNEPYCRPDYRAPLRVDTALLLTCRLAWLEFNHTPLKNAVHPFWFYHGPPSATLGVAQFDNYFQCMTVRNRSTLQHVQIFMEAYWIDNICHPKLFRSMFKLSVICPKILTITMRHVDLKSFVVRNQLIFNPAWIKVIIDSAFTNRARIRVNKGQGEAA